ncbi:MAG: pyridoxal kinase [Alphaproteobacteria bacterium]|nr:pyridoxal kinase [Alphaproteobacteria bacterium]
MPERRTILSIQSDVIRGHVGNGAARFALQRLGYDVWALPTILLSNHPGHAKFRGETTPTTHLRALLEGIVDNGWLSQCAGVVSGYLGSADQAAFVANAVAQVKQANPNALYLCDPVFGDDDGAYARPGVAEAMARHLVPLADIVAPNRFELASLTARSITNAADAVAATRSLARGEVLVTSVPFGGAEIGSLVVTRTEAAATVTRRLDGVPHGTGDLLSALYLERRLSGASPREALEKAASATNAIICNSIGQDELKLVQSQQLLIDPIPRLSSITL